MLAFSIVVGVLAVLIVLGLSLRIVKQWQRGVVLRFGKLLGVRDPGFRLMIPVVDRMIKVDLRVVTMVLEPQELITKDNVTIKVNAVVYFRVIDPEGAVMRVEDYKQATTQMALTTLRSVLGQSELDEVLAHREEINEKLRGIIDEQTERPWGVKVTVVEVKDVLLPEAMQRSMAKQAEAEREKRAKIVHAHGEFEAAETLAQAADIIARHPVSLQLRYLQTMVEIAGERTSTIIPMPIDIMGALRDALGQERPQGG